MDAKTNPLHLFEDTPIPFFRYAEWSEEEYESVLDSLFEICFGQGGAGRKAEVAVDLGGGTEHMRAGVALVNAVLLFPYANAGVQPGADRFVRSQLDSGSLARHMDRTIEDLYTALPSQDLNYAMSAVARFLADAACQTTTSVGTSVSILGLFDAARKDPVIWDLLHWKVPAGDHSTIEKAADAATAELISRLAGASAEYGRLLRCGSAINKDQFRQAFLNIGIKPGLRENDLIDTPVDTNYTVGMRDVQDFFTSAVGARKALITNFHQVKSSGYLSRKIVLLIADHNLSRKVEDCGTRHGLTTQVVSEDHARRLHGRSIRDSQTGNWYRPSDAQWAGLVGEFVKLRSPITCASSDGVCHQCYGDLAHSNSDIHAGIYGVLVICEQITQRLLSSKHLLKAAPKVPEIKGLEDDFAIDRSTLYAEQTVTEVSINLDDIEEDDDGRQYTSSIYWRRAKGDRKSRGTEMHAEIVTTPLFLDESTWGDAEVANSRLTVQPHPEMPLFSIRVDNSDLSEALKLVFYLIERVENENVHAMYADLMGAILKSAIRTPSVHVEMILRALVRSADELSERPDFSVGPDEPRYTILKLPAAIKASASLSTALAFERIKEQLTSVEVLDKKKAGLFDALFNG